LNPVDSVDLQIDLGAFFEPYVRQWLIVTDNKTGQWVEAVRISYLFSPWLYILMVWSRRLQLTR
jgi:hypothetical protein